MSLNWSAILSYAEAGAPPPPQRVEKTPDQWRELLTPEQFRVTRESGTERAFSSVMCGLFQPGIYSCVCCGTALFDANQKFESGSGWPSFTEPLAENVVAYHKDESHGMVRVETTCNVCDAHLGHVFPDGPAQSTGLRFCINAAALTKAAANSK